ncbi:MAG: hypothetical protein AAGE52_38685, partial [Myxococcota bacterium]
MRAMKGVLGWLALGAFAASCAGDVAVELDQVSIDDATDEMRRRMNIRLTQGDETIEGPAEEVAVAMAAQCAKTLGLTCPPSSDETRRCEYLHCQAEIAECVANELLNIAGDEPSVIELSEPFAGTWMIAPQSTATKASIAQTAAFYGYFSSVAAFAYLRVATFDPLNADCGNNPIVYAAADGIPAIRRQEAGATVLRSSLDVIDEALALHHQWTLSVADAQHSDQASIDEAARQALLLGVGSRNVVAHSWVGGELGLDALHDVSEEGFCPDPRLSAAARRAEELIRTTGVNPQELLIEQPTELLLNAHIRPRLADILEAPQLLPSRTTIDEFYEGFGLNEQAFADARTYLAGELRAFGRDLRAQILDVPGFDGRAGDTDVMPPPVGFYAATVNPPVQPMQSFWTAVAAYEFQSLVTSPPSIIPYDAGVEPTVQGMNGLLDTIVSGAQWIASENSLEPTAQTVIQELAGELAGRRKGRLQICLGGEEIQTTEVRYITDEPVGDLAVVVGHGGLQCAVRGSVEGAPCDLDEYLLTGDFKEVNAPFGSGFTMEHRALFETGIFDNLVRRQFDDPVVDEDETFYLPIFVVRQQSGTGPGGYEEVGGMVMGLPVYFANADGGGEEYLCRTVSIVPEMDERAAEAIAPSTSYCAMSAQTCAGIPIDQRLPLENELINDGDAFESSWRHYLNLAREAADHADRLGEDLIRAGLEMDIRGEQAIDELEELCGVSLNVTELGASVPPGTDPVEHAMTLLNDADQLRLASCLGGGSTIDWVTLGHKPLCFTWDDSSPDSFCAGGGDCPRSVAVGGECEGTEETAQPLAFFELSPEAEADLADDEVGLPPCAELAALRGGVATELTEDQLVAAILAHPLFAERARTQRAAEQLGWVAYPGDYSAVTVSDGSWLGTGNYLADTSPSWPCTNPQNPDRRCESAGVYDPDGNEAFFCNELPAAACSGASRYDLANRTDRAQMNDMMARAVIAAKVIAGVPLNGLQVPFYPRLPGDPLHKFAVTDGDSIDDPAPWPAFQARPLSRTHSGVTATIYTSQGAVFRLDKDGDFPGPVDFAMFDMGQGQVYYVANTAGADQGIEWLFAPYDHGSYVEIFDDAPDADDDASSTELYDLDFPLIVRGVDGDAANGTDVAAALEEMWSGAPGGFSGYIERVLRNPGGSHPLGPNEEGIERMTRYWRRTSTGATGLAGEFFEMYERLTGICFSNIDLTDPDGCRETVGCHRYYEDCRQAAGEGFDFDVTLDGNRAFIAPQGLNTQDVLNGMELLCAVDELESPSGYDCSQPVAIQSVGDLFSAQGFLECQADSIRNNAASMILRDMPSQVVDLLGSGGTSATAGNGVSGELAAATDELRAALIELSDTSTQIGATVDSMAAAVGALRSRSQQLSIRAEIGQWQLASTVLNQITTCVSKVAEAAGGTNVGAGVAAGAVCANSGAQIMIAARTTSLQEDLDQEALREALYRFEQEFNGAISGLSGADTRLRATVARIEAAITRIQNLQRRGRRALAKALMLDSSPDEAGADGAMGRRYFVNTAMRRRMNTLRVRYEDAQKNAVRTAFLAKLALEQRLGMGLDEMTDPMALVDEPPASWHMDVCSLSGIDYDRIRDSTAPPTG